VCQSTVALAFGHKTEKEFHLIAGLFASIQTKHQISSGIISIGVQLQMHTVTPLSLLYQELIFFCAAE